ncbi:hypothetical protein LOAG_10230 [Loa loa]|uniref:Uncharacterized protein n=1 Tax=Loa loa TaxID=7209 RepID=A0A1S0TQ78_LOALO|nr:hypothetical protein LOAG_10230 [Loa loa]EFO18266.1 hypothetical protein LOAG_10230 [Loa loa]
MKAHVKTHSCLRVCKCFQNVAILLPSICETYSYKKTFIRTFSPVLAILLFIPQILILSPTLFLLKNSAVQACHDDVTPNDSIHFLGCIDICIFAARINSLHGVCFFELQSGIFSNFTKFPWRHPFIRQKVNDSNELSDEMNKNDIDLLIKSIISEIIVS